MLGSRSLGSLALASALLQDTTTIQQITPTVVIGLMTKDEVKILTSKKQGPIQLETKDETVILPKGKNSVIRLTNNKNREIPI